MRSEKKSRTVLPGPRSLDMLLAPYNSCLALEERITIYIYVVYTYIYIYISISIYLSI